MPLPRVEQLGDWLHLTLLDGEDVLIAIRQIKQFHGDSKSGGTAIYTDKEPVIVQETLEHVFKLIVNDQTGGTSHR